MRQKTANSRKWCRYCGCYRRVNRTLSGELQCSVCNISRIDAQRTEPTDKTEQED